MKALIVALVLIGLSGLVGIKGHAQESTGTPAPGASMNGAEDREPAKAEKKSKKKKHHAKKKSGN